jgi:hypothetical protein
MALFNDHGKTRNRSDSSSGEEEPLIKKQNKIVSYGAQEYSSTGVRICNLHRFVLRLGEVSSCGQAIDSIQPQFSSLFL